MAPVAQVLCVCLLWTGVMSKQWPTSIFQASDSFAPASVDSLTNSIPNNPYINEDPPTTLGPAWFQEQPADEDPPQSNSNAPSSSTTSIHEPPSSIISSYADSAPLMTLEMDHPEDDLADMKDTQIDVDTLPIRLRNALMNAEEEDHPMLAEAKRNYISIWNLEAMTLQAPYLQIDQVWPGLGMVYMPTINSMTQRIQKQESVKAAAIRLKDLWERLHPGQESGFTSNGSLLDAFEELFGSKGKSDHQDNGVLENPETMEDEPAPLNSPMEE